MVLLVAHSKRSARLEYSLPNFTWDVYYGYSIRVYLTTVHAMRFAAKDRIIAKYRTRLRDAAINRARSRLAVDGLSPSDLSEEEMEVIVAEEEARIKSRLKDLSFGALITALTLGHF